MKCKDCPYGKKVPGCIGLIECEQRGGSRDEEEGCELIEAVRVGNRNKVNRILKKDQVDPEADTLEIDLSDSPYWPYDSDLLIVDDFDGHNWICIDIISEEKS